MSLLLLQAVLVLKAPILQLLLGLPVLFFVPGYALASLIMRSRRDIGLIESVAIVAGLSALFFPALGLLLGLVGLPLRAEYFAAAAAAVTAVALVPRALRLDGVGDLQAPLAALRSWLTLPGHTGRQRSVGRLVVVGTFVTIGALMVMAIVPPATTPDLELALVGPDGHVTSLPTTASVAAILQVSVYLRNSPGSATYSLRLRANAPVGTYSAIYSQVPWVLPLTLQNGTESSTTEDLRSGEVRSVLVEFSFLRAGEYGLQFDLVASDGIVVRSAMLPIVVL